MYLIVARQGVKIIDNSVVVHKIGLALIALFPDKVKFCNLTFSMEKVK